MFFRSRKKADLTEAVSNARQIGFALFEFESEFGAFPDGATAAAVRKKTGALLPLGTTTSNDLFRQLLAANITQSERMFYAHIPGAKKPDDNILGAEALKKAECGFTYLLGARITDNPSRPLVVTAMIPGSDRFDKNNALEGRAVVLRMDNSVTALPIDKDGHVMLDGRNMMDPHHPIWDGHAPVIAWPDM